MQNMPGPSQHGNKPRPPKPIFENKQQREAPVRDPSPPSNINMGPPPRGSQHQNQQRSFNNNQPSTFSPYEEPEPQHHQ